MLIAALLAAAAPQPDALPIADAPVPREAHNFHDWVVACDNGRRCQAVGLMPEGQVENFNGVMVIERGPGSEAPLTLRLAQVEGMPARLMVYSEALPVRLTEADGDFLIEIEDRSAFMERILYGRQIELQDANGASIGQLSLKGLTGAMLYMDEVQGRLHTGTALIRTGLRPASDVPPAPQVPSVRIASAAREAPINIPAARIAQLRRESGCSIEEVGGPDTVITGALGGGRTLVLLACGAGAYNYTGIPFVAARDGRDTSIEPAPFDIPLSEWEEEEGRRILVNPDWDAESMTIADFSKGRGLGDCGTRSTYGWDGARFRLVAREEMPECRGSVVYVTTWRVDVAR